MFTLNIQTIVVAIYFLIITLAGWFTRKLSKSSSDYLIAGRNLGLTLCTVSIVGEWLGGMSTVGTAEKAYTSGLFPIWYNFSTALGMLLFGKFIAVEYRKREVHTVGEMLEKMYSRRTRLIISLCFIAAFVILGYIQLQTIGSIAAQILRIDFNTAIIISGIIVTIYVYLGGMKSIALTNLIHVIMLYITLAIIFTIIMMKTGGPTGLAEKLTSTLSPEEASAFLNPFSKGPGQVLAWVIGGILAGFASQASIQPVFAARNIETAKKSAYLSALFIAPVGIVIATASLAVKAGIAGSMPPTAKETLPFLLMRPDLFPPWISGVAIAGILAAILSTIAPVMFSVSTIITKDLYNLLTGERRKDSQLLKVSRTSVLVIGAITIPMALFFKGGILDTAYITYAIRGSAALAIITALRFTKKGQSLLSSTAVIYATILSTIAAILLPVFKQELFSLTGITIDKVYGSIGTFIISSLIITIVEKRRKAA